MVEEQKVKQRRAPRKPYCRQCKERKVKCDMLQPSCKRCTRRGRSCIYDDFPVSLASKVAGAGNDVKSESTSVNKVTDDPDLLKLPTRASPETTVTIKRNSAHSLQEILHELEPCATQDVLQHMTNSAWPMPGLNIRPSSRPSFEIVYTSAFTSRIQSPSTFFARPREWLEILDVENDTLVNASVRACGALYVGHATQASMYYCHCLQRLRKLSAATSRDISSVLKICLVVMFLFIYETSVPDGTIEAFQTHLDGIANLLKEVVAISRRSRALSGMSAAQAAISHLLVAEFRRIECVRIALLRIPPAISAEDYDELLPQHHLYEEHSHDEQLMWSVHHLTGDGYGLPDEGKALVLAQIEQKLHTASWAHKPLKISILTPSLADLCLDTQPFDSGLYIAEATVRDTRTISSLYMYCEVAILRLQMTMSAFTKEEKTLIMYRADRCARFVLFLLTYEHQGNLSWLALALLSLFETFSMLCPPADLRIAWARGLIQSFRGRVSSGISYLIEHEVSRIDAASLARTQSYVAEAYTG